MHQGIWHMICLLCLGDGDKRLSEICGCQQGAQSNLSPAAAGAGGIGRGGTPDRAKLLLHPALPHSQGLVLLLDLR